MTNLEAGRGALLPTADDPDDYPRSRRLEEVRARRRAMLQAPHMAPLLQYLDVLRQKPHTSVPDFDPLDGGTEARLLFLLEKPGPMTSNGGASCRQGSGFISRNNDDPTAEATWHFMRQAQVPRRATVTWNVVPWWNGTIKVTAEELQDGLACLRDLLRLLPRLEVLVLVGKKAARGAPLLDGTGLRVFTSAHPSPKVRAVFPGQWNAIGVAWGAAYSALSPRPPVSFIPAASP